jgi:hypothetical protein
MEVESPPLKGERFVPTAVGANQGDVRNEHACFLKLKELSIQKFAKH